MTTLKTPDAIATEAVTQILATDGATVSPYVGVPVPTSGYVVSLAGYEARVRRTGHVAGLHTALVDYCQRNRAALATEVRYVGVWRDVDTLYLDVSVVVSERADAITFGRKNYQIAIWDLSNSKEIYL